ncbi:hypothetical protein V6Z12_A13G234900 [Gossypium hirsutum]
MLVRKYALFVGTVMDGKRLIIRIFPEGLGGLAMAYFSSLVR